MSLHHIAERLAHSNAPVWLGKVIRDFGITVKVFRSEQSVHRDVYGVEAGDEKSSAVGSVDVALVSDDFFPVDFHAGGAFNEGWLYTRSPIVGVGDRVEVVRVDGRTRRFKVESQVSLGTTESSFKRFRVVALGD